MRVVIYDKKPGQGFEQWMLMACWFVAAHVQKLFGKVDVVKGFTSWNEMCHWLVHCEIQLFSSIQYWGHGSPGNVWMNGQPLQKEELLQLRNKLSAQSVLWFRTCSTFQGARGQKFASYLANNLDCIIAGHTRIIGLLQGGLHTITPRTMPSWSVDEGEPKSWLPSYLVWGPNTIICFATRIPKGW